MNEEEMLATLKASEIFAVDYPRLTRYSADELAALSPEERKNWYEIIHNANVQVKNRWVLIDIVIQLGKSKYPPAVPVLIELWNTCVIGQIRGASGQALRANGTPEARQALKIGIDSTDYDRVERAVQIMFEENPMGSFDRFAEYFEPNLIQNTDRLRIQHAVIKQFAPSGHLLVAEGNVIPEWSDPNLHSLLYKDRRWLELLVSLRHHERLGALVRGVLRDTHFDVVKPVLEEVKARETPHVVKIATQGKGDLLTRYLRGEHIAVWNELRSYEAVAGDLFLEAQAVVKETMKRVSHNADLLAERLEDLGWQSYYLEMRPSPEEGDQAIMSRIEGYAGARLPLSLRIFWEIVGGINFVWDHQIGPAPNMGVGVKMDRMDPLYISPVSILDFHFEDWEDQRYEIDPEFWDPLHLTLSADHYHKCEISGGAPYTVLLPFLGVDPILEYEGHDFPFVDYLRYAMKWGGFPMLDQHAERSDVQEFVKRMTDGLEPF